MTNFLILLAVGSVWFALLMLEIHQQHQELMSYLNDLATMIGEWLEEQER